MKESKKYIIVLVLTLGIFAIVFLFNSFLNKKRIEHIHQLQQQISIDLIANETQFDLLKNAPCEIILSHSILSQQLDELGKKLSFLEETQNNDSENFLMVKKYYSLLEVKDYLLSEEIRKKCHEKKDSIIYLYGSDCKQCTKQGYVLTELKRKYPWLRIYSFDLDLDFSLIDSFTAIYDIKEKPPILIINQNKYDGFHSVEEIQTLLPALEIQRKQALKKERARAFLLGHEELSLDDEKLFFHEFLKEDTFRFVYKDEDHEEYISVVFSDDEPSLAREDKKRENKGNKKHSK